MHSSSTVYKVIFIKSLDVSLLIWYRYIANIIHNNIKGKPGKLNARKCVKME